MYISKRDDYNLQCTCTVPLSLPPFSLPPFSLPPLSFFSGKGYFSYSSPWSKFPSTISLSLSLLAYPPFIPSPLLLFYISFSLTYMYSFSLSPSPSFSLLLAGRRSRMFTRQLLLPLRVLSVTCVRLSLVMLIVYFNKIQLK